jgi:glycosyl transferase family 25
MRIFLINLERRPDRLAAMKDQLDRLGLAFERFDAVDARTADPAELNAPFAPDGPLGPLSAGEKGCLSSHLRLWRRIASGEDRHAVILEDDVVLSGDAPKFLGDDAWIPREAGLLKLERFGDANQLFFVGKRRTCVLGRQAAPLLSKQYGSGGYIIARETAAMLAGTEKPALPIDHLLFNPAYSPVFGRLKPWQLFPALLEQRVEVGNMTDVQRPKPRGWPLLKHKIRRAVSDFGVLPSQIAAVIAGRACIIRIEFA